MFEKGNSIDHDVKNINSNETIFYVTRINEEHYMYWSKK